VSAARLAEQEIRKISGPVFHRSDIGSEALIAQRLGMMDKLRKKYPER
jgi:hypothetical protein